jgi:hypothetical protein
MLAGGEALSDNYMESTSCGMPVAMTCSNGITSTTGIRTTSVHAPDLPDGSFLPSSKIAKAVYAARPLLMVPTPTSLFLLLSTSTPTVFGLLK